MSKTIIKKFLREGLKNDDIWYHGTPDVRALEKIGGFSERTNTIRYVKDLEAFNEIQSKMKVAVESGNEDAYHKLLDLIGKVYDEFKMRKPIFLTNDYNVAKTYADSRRSFDYQNSVEKVLKVKVTTNKGVTINAVGDRFRFLNLDKVKKGFINAGVDRDELNKTISRFNFYVKNDEGIKTDVVAAIGEWFGFDYIDVVGVLDSYEGGSIKSTVRMVFNPNDIKIIK